MEKNLLKLSLMKVSVRKLALLVLIMVSTLYEVNAGGRVPITNNNDIAVSPEGIIDDEMIFNVQYNNVNEDKLDIILMDADGNKLYNDVFSGKLLKKTFKVNADYGKVYLIIHNTANEIEQKFVISTKNTGKLLITSAY